MKNKIFIRYLKFYKRFQVSKTPQMNLVWGFFLYTMTGFALLSLPIFHKTSISLLDNLFTATSAISTTSLVTVSVPDSYNFFGQAVIMVLFQIGGVGYMTLTTYYLLFTTRRITHWHSKIIGTAFTMPEGIKIDDFLKSVILFTIIMETLGALAFFVAFKSSGMETWQAVWYAIFHSISAFCTAGFDLFDHSFQGYQNDVFVNSIISVLAIAGSLGFIVITDLWYLVSGKSKKLSFTSKIVLGGFMVLLLGGTLLIYYSEPLVNQNGDSRLLKSFFQSMSAMTTVGFSTVPTEKLSLPILLLVIFLMYVGASPSGTAGGMKITTLVAMISVLKSRMSGQKQITFMHRVIPFERLYVATSTFILYTSLIFLFTFFLAFTEPFSFDELLFEVASALGGVGLSTGITGSLSAYGKILFIILMFVGRVGVLTFGFALLERNREVEIQTSDNDLAV